MTRSTNMEHVEVLERLRYRWAMPDEHAALDAAIAALSAPQPSREAPTMTADIELLPLPEALFETGSLRDLFNVAQMQGYARANVAHAIAAKDVEIAELVNDRDDLLARLDASIDHGTKLGAAQQRCLDEVLELKDEIETLRAALESLKAHMGNAVMSRDGIIKALEDTRDGQGDEIHRLRAELDRLRGELRGEHVRVCRDRNAKAARAERLTGALRELVEYVQETAHHNAPAAAAARAALRDHDQEEE